MREIFKITIAGSLRQSVFKIILIIGILLFLTTPFFASFSMFSVSGVAVDFTLETTFVMGFLLILFYGGLLITKDMERKTIYGVLSYPISRTDYLTGRFLGFATVLFFSTLVLGIMGFASSYIAGKIYPPLNISAYHYTIALLFIFIQLLLLFSFSGLFSSFATEQYLPSLLTVAVYLIGTASQPVKEFVESEVRFHRISRGIYLLVKTGYYVFPNFYWIDFKLQASHILPLKRANIFNGLIYGVVYFLVVFMLSAVIFEKREFQ